MTLKITRIQRLSAVIGISLSFFIAEISVGFYTGSLALVADAFHYLSDIVGFAVALAAAIVAEKASVPPSLTFGWQRAQLLGAFFNGVLLLGLGISIFLQSIERFISLQRVENPKLVMIIGCVGFALNLISVSFLHEHDHGHEHKIGHNDPEDERENHDDNGQIIPEEPAPVNKKHLTHKHHANATSLQPQKNFDLALMGVFIHIMGDCANNVGVIISGLVIWLTNYGGRYYADPAVSMAIAIMIFASSLPLVKRAGLILLQSAPEGVEQAHVKSDLEQIPGIAAVHELHIWRLDQKKSLASAHLVLDESGDQADFDALAKTAMECFHAYGIHSVTLQPEILRGRTAAEQAGNSSGLEKARFVDLLPSFEVANHLINLYMSTYETTFRVVHEPSFLQDWASFWDSRLEDSRRSGSEDILLAKYLTMMACASCLANDTFILAAGSDQTALSQLSHKWLQAVVLWLDSIPEHALLDLHVMQVKCLLVTARQAIAWSGDLVGIMAGSLIREAVMMGLHRDPALFSNMSPYWAETRKRLWLTVVETELQLSLHLGIPLALSWEDFDCPLPINIEDEHFSPSSTSMPPERDISTLTKTTFQIVLAQSLRVRMEISKLINRARLRMDSNEIMSLSDSLMSSLNEAPAQLRDDSGTGDARNYAFQRSFYMFLIWRSMLALHRPVFLNLVDVGKEVYSVSRMHCVQASVALLAQLELVSQISADVTPRPVDMFLPHVLRLKGGLFQDDIFHAALTVCLELRLELKDNQPSLLTGRISNLVSQSALFHRKALFQSIENALEYFKNKVQWEARACKTFTTLCILHMNLESQFATRAAPVTNGGASSSRPALSIEEACPLASRRCLELLEGTRHNSHRNPIHDEDDDASLPNSGPDEVVPGSAPWNGDIMTDMSNKEMRDLALASVYSNPAGLILGGGFASVAARRILAAFLTGGDIGTLLADYITAGLQVTVGSWSSRSGVKPLRGQGHYIPGQSSAFLAHWFCHLRDRK
ncbi:metal ion resistance protein/transporter (Zrc1), putative [Cordyceps militaris CM01]|uniref:Metal ion resistance protein/transporter (Zrc1), putative n=1 Tax=Cordyceps militaris (strain CM01) TaxID=983644 RepID=G3JS27_CORMM|nr:metal ion resistance protein/transporter (Zrc1), putative [Cordyceps militaris CM01]EGX88673.1 metal ion resistance protein/transporter (Zrc1), putative [Cordyceps militaris CM01]